MKTRDTEALAYVLESGLWETDYETGEVLTSRDIHGRPTDPPVWRPCTFLSPSKKSSTRKRIWVRGQRVYASRVNWVLHHKKPIPEGFQIDHDDDDSLNDRPDNLVLMDAEGNRVKELANGRVKRFERSPPREYLSHGQMIISPYGEWAVSITNIPETSEYVPIREPLDWRINILRDIKSRSLAILRRLRRWFDRFILGFR